MIKLTSVCKTYQTGRLSFSALKNISLEIPKGEFLSIAGPSGCGKSTLLHLLGGLDRPTTGSLEIEGRNLNHLNEQELASFRNEKVGFVFQFFNLLPNLSALDNVILPLIYSSQKIDRGKARELLDAVGLKEKLKAKPRELSGGEQQRVALARALVTDPKLILADEPTGNLDQKTGAQILDLLLNFHQQGKTLVVVTHDQSIAQRASHIIHLQDGQIV